MKKALITGITGQDGAYLAEFPLAKNYAVHGIKRRSSMFNTGRIDNLYHDPHETGLPFVLHHGDLSDATNLIRIIQQAPATLFCTSVPLPSAAGRSRAQKSLEPFQRPQRFPHTTSGSRR